MTHICVSKVTIIVSDNGLSSGRRQAIVWNNAEILLIEPLGTNFSGILIEIHTFAVKKMHLKMSSGKWRPFCLGLNVFKFDFFLSNQCEMITGYTSLTHWGRDKMAAIIQTTLSNAFSWMKMLEFRLKFHWSLFLRVQLTRFQHCLR